MTEEILKRLNELLDETDFSKISSLSNIKHSKLRAIRQNKNLPSIEIIIELSEFCNCSVSYILSLSKFPNEFKKGLDVANIGYNIRRFIELHPPRFFYLKCRGFLNNFLLSQNGLMAAFVPIHITL
nr:MAG TPA: DNA-binding protein [Caudoviricetes sp.]